MMKLRYMWLDRKYLIGKQWERFIIKVAYLLPRRLTMWAYIRVANNATTGKYENTVVPDLTMMEALERWETK